MARRRILVTAGVVGLVAAAAALGFATLASTGVAGARQAPPRGTFDLTRAEAFTGFPLYSAGASVDGYALTAVLRRNDAADYVSFVYGDCVVESDTGCAPPVEIQVWPACKRHFALYETGLAGLPSGERTTVRGAPAALFDGGRRLELQTGRATVVVFAGSLAATLRVASALRGVNVATQAAASLPPAADGAVEGRLRC